MIYKTVNVGAVTVGGAAPISIQSMCSIPFSRFDELVRQAKELEEAGYLAEAGEQRRVHERLPG